MINPDLEGAIQASLKQEIADQDQFDSVMGWLGKMVSACNFMEQTFQAFLVRLLQCRQAEMALIVGCERRQFRAVVDLIEQLFAVYAQDQSARDDLQAVGKIAKGLYEERNKYVHSVWYLVPSELTKTTPAHRYKDKKNAKPISVHASELSTLVGKFDDCSQKLSKLMDRYLD